MKTSLKSLFAFVAVAASSIALQAQPAPKIVLIDFSKIVDGWYRTEEFKTVLQSDMKKAQTSIDEQQAQLNTISNQYKEAVEAAKGAALSADAKKKAEEDAIKIGSEGQKVLNNIETLKRTASGSLQDRQRNHLELAYEEARAVATDLAKKKGANLVLEKSGATNVGVSPIFYADAAFDITDEVLIEMNKKRPAAPAVAPSAPAAESTSPSITVPGLKK